MAALTVGGDTAVGAGSRGTSITYSRNFISDQSWEGVQRLLGTSSIAYDVSLGLGVATADSILFATNFGVAADYSLTGVMRYTSPTTAGSESMGLLVRFSTNHSPDATYYYVRQDAQKAKLVSVVDGTFTTLAESNFALPADTDLTISGSVRRVGGANQLSFTWSASGLSDVLLEASDSDIGAGGIVGFRTSSAVGYLKSLSGAFL